jgi:hypothetical protein
MNAAWAPPSDYGSLKWLSAASRRSPCFGADRALGGPLRRARIFLVNLHNRERPALKWPFVGKLWAYSQGLGNLVSAGHGLEELINTYLAGAVVRWRFISARVFKPMIAILALLLALLASAWLQSANAAFSPMGVNAYPAVVRATVPIMAREPREALHSRLWEQDLSS